MDNKIQLEEIRELFLNAPESDATRFLAIAGSISAVGLTLVSVIPGLLQWITRLIGAWTPSSTLFFLGEACLVLLCLNFAVQISRAGVRIKTLGQEVAILRARLDAREASTPEGRG